MRLLSALVCLLAFSLPLPAQQPPANNYDFDQYTKALAHYGYTAINHISLSQDEKNLVPLATMDPTLAKSPAVRGITLNILGKLNALNEATKRSNRDMAAARKKMDGQVVVSSSKPSYRNQPPKQDKQFEAMTEMSKIGVELAKLKDATHDAVEAQIAQLSALEGAPEGQAFAMPPTSAFLTALLSVDRLPGMPSNPGTGIGRQPEFHYYEVVTTSPEGFYGYATKLDLYTEQTGDHPAGSAKMDARGNYIHIRDPSKNIFIRGYTKPAAMGDIIRIQTIPGETKVVNGVQVHEYTYVP